MNLARTRSRPAHNSACRGMADVLETRLRRPRAERLAPARPRRHARQRRTRPPPGPPARARRAQGGRFRDPGQSARHLRLRLQQEDEPRADLRAGHRALRRPARGRAPARAAGHRARATWPRPSACAAIQQGYRVLYREAHTLSRSWPRPRSTARARAHGRPRDVPLLIIDDLGMRKLPPTAAEDLLELDHAPLRTGLARCSPRTGRSTTGASCSATPPPSRRCSTASSTTRTCSSAGRGAGARRSTHRLASTPALTK